MMSCVFESFDTFRALCSYSVILDRKCSWGCISVAALSFGPDCHTGTVIAPLQKIRACVIEPNKDSFQKVVILSFNSYDSRWDQWRTQHLGVFVPFEQSSVTLYKLLCNYLKGKKYKFLNHLLHCPSNSSHHF